MRPAGGLHGRAARMVAPPPFVAARLLLLGTGRATCVLFTCGARGTVTVGAKASTERRCRGVSTATVDLDGMENRP